MKKYKGFDWVLALSAVAIFLLGLLFLFSSTYPHNIDYVLRQITWFLLGMLIFFFTAKVNYRKIVGIGNAFYSLIIFLLIAVLIFGSRRLGAKEYLCPTDHSVGAFYPYNGRT